MPQIRHTSHNDEVYLRQSLLQFSILQFFFMHAFISSSCHSITSHLQPYIRDSRLALYPPQNITFPKSPLNPMCGGVPALYTTPPLEQKDWHQLDPWRAIWFKPSTFLAWRSGFRLAVDASSGADHGVGSAMGCSFSFQL
jgi:hypothetical protein